MGTLYEATKEGPGRKRRTPTPTTIPTRPPNVGPSEALTWARENRGAFTCPSSTRDSMMGAELEAGTRCEASREGPGRIPRSVELAAQCRPRTLTQNTPLQLPQARPSAHDSRRGGSSASSRDIEARRTGSSLPRSSELPVPVAVGGPQARPSAHDSRRGGDSASPRGIEAHRTGSSKLPVRGEEPETFSSRRRPNLPRAPFQGMPSSSHLHRFWEETAAAEEAAATHSAFATGTLGRSEAVGAAVAAQAQVHSSGLAKTVPRAASREHDPVGNDPHDWDDNTAARLSKTAAMLAQLSRSRRVIHI